MSIDLTPWKTYATGSLIIVHQVLKAFGIDVPEAETSALVDGVLAVLTIVFRLTGYFDAKKAVQVALYTPVPTDEPKP